MKRKSPVGTVTSNSSPNSSASPSVWFPLMIEKATSMDSTGPRKIGSHFPARSCNACLVRYKEPAVANGMAKLNVKRRYCIEIQDGQRLADQCPNFAIAPQDANKLIAQLSSHMPHNQYSS